VKLQLSQSINGIVAVIWNMVTTFRENLEMLGDVCQVIDQKSGKCQEKSRQGQLFIANLQFGAALMFSRLLRGTLVRL